MTTNCQHGFSAPALCPVCQHFGKIRESEAAERKLRESQELEQLDSDGLNEGDSK